MLKIKNFLILVLLTLNSTAAIAAEPENAFLQVYTELAVTDGHTEKFTDDGVPAGIETDLVRAVLADAGIEYQIQVVPWVRAVQAIDASRNVVVYSMARTPEREDKYHWIGQVLPLDFHLYGLRENIDSLPKNLREASTARIGVLRADVVGIYLESLGFTNLVYVTEPSRNLDMLKRSRIDLFPYTRHSVGSFVEANEFNPEDLIGVIRLDEISTGLYMVVSKNTDNAIVERLRKSYRDVVSSNNFEENFDTTYRPQRSAEIEVLDAAEQ